MMVWLNRSNVQKRRYQRKYNGKCIPYKASNALKRIKKGAVMYSLYEETEKIVNGNAIEKDNSE